MQINQSMNTDVAQKLGRIEGYLVSDPGNRDLLASAIDLCLSLGQIESARKHADAAIVFFPEDVFFQHRHANVLIAQGQLDEAVAVLEKLHRDLADPAIAYNLAYAYFRLSRYTDANAALVPCAELPDAPPATVTLFMRTLHHLGEIKQALEVVQRNAERCSGASDFLAAASLLYLDEGQLEQAQRLSAASLAAGARPLEALVVSGTVALGLGDIAIANARFAEALKISPTDGRSWSGLGLTSLFNNDLAAAEQQLERATEGLPTHIGTLHALGWCRILNKNLNGAEASFRKALALDRNFGESHGGLAVVHALQGNGNLAEESINRALRLDPRSLSAKYAQMVISGSIADADKFKEIALKILAGRQGPFGASLAEMLVKRTRG